MAHEQRIDSSIDRHPAGGTTRTTSRGRSITTVVARKVRDAAIRLESHRVHTNDSSKDEEAMFWRMVHLELERARRHQRDFVVVSVECESAQTARTTAERIRPAIRFEDEVVARRTKVLFMLSEVGPELAPGVIDRIAHEVPDVRGRDLTTVAFPDETLTYHDLVEHVLGAHRVTSLRLAG